MKINKKNLIIFIILFIIETFIALYVHDNFIRPFIWDLLVVILIFYFIKIFVNNNKKNINIIIWVFIFSIFFEFMQYLNLIEILNIQNKIIKIIVGSVFDWKDILSYWIGCGILIIKEIKNLKKSNIMVYYK